MELILSIAPSDLLLHPFPDRCLQHTKQNLRQEAKKKDPVSGDPRLSRAELLPVLVSFVLGSAWFPSSLEFRTFWDSVLSRLSADSSETDWGEPSIAQYLEKNLLKKTLDGWSAAWRTGFGAVPAGLTTYASNSLEATWRTVKGLLKPGCLGTKTFHTV